MSEYWKSLPRKFCDICKCWFADNKSSIEFHERGKRHKDNAQKRIQEIQKRGNKEFKKQKELEDDMKKIEKAALAAYQKDLQNNVADAPFTEFPQAISDKTEEASMTKKKDMKPKKEKKKAPSKEIKPDVLKKWYEAMTDEGHKYYYHSETSESRWEPPDEGFISIEEQSSEKNTMSPNDEVYSVHREETPAKNSKKRKKELLPMVGPQPKAEPYGQWVTIEEQPEEFVDLQLPVISNDTVEVSIPVVRDEPKVRFKEKVIGALSVSDSSEEVTFKKRKLGNASKRNVRQRTEDD